MIISNTCKNGTILEMRLKPWIWISAATNATRFKRWSQMPTLRPEGVTFLSFGVKNARPEIVPIPKEVSAT